MIDIKSSVSKFQSLVPQTFLLGLVGKKESLSIPPTCQEKELTKVRPSVEEINSTIERLLELRDEQPFKSPNELVNIQYNLFHGTHDLFINLAYPDAILDCCEEVISHGYCRDYTESLSKSKELSYNYYKCSNMINLINGREICISYSNPINRELDRVMSIFSENQEEYARIILEPTIEDYEFRVKELCYSSDNKKNDQVCVIPYYNRKDKLFGKSEIWAFGNNFDFSRPYYRNQVYSTSEGILCCSTYYGKYGSKASRFFLNGKEIGKVRYKKHLLELLSTPR